MPNELPAEWRRWAAENLMRGVPVERVEATLRAHGLDPGAVERELSALQDHPWFHAGRAVGRELVRRHWLLEALADLAALDPEARALERRPLPPFAAFLREHYARNRPGWFGGAVEHWPARRWTPASLQERFGEVPVEVQAGRAGDPRYEERSHRHKERMALGDFLSAVQGGPSNDLYMTANNGAVNGEALAPLFDDVGPLGDGYLDLARVREQGFVWIGPAGVVTPLHHDLTNNLMVQLFGRKRVRLVPALEVARVANHHHVYSRVDPLAPDHAACPDWGRATVLDVILEPGDVLFIPVGWWHHVVGVDVTIGLSFTCLAAPNDFPRAPEPSPD